MKPTLEDYIFDMETRPQDHGHGTPNDQDLWTQLQKKESDLLLAAELGKALLEKNEDLAKQQEKMIDEYSKKLEVSFFKFFSFNFLTIFDFFLPGIFHFLRDRKISKLFEFQEFAAVILLPVKMRAMAKTHTYVIAFH